MRERSYLEKKREDVKKSLEEHVKLFQEITQSQKKLTFQRDRTLQKIATLEGAFEAYEDCLSQSPPLQTQDSSLNDGV